MSPIILNENTLADIFKAQRESAGARMRSVREWPTMKAAGKLSAREIQKLRRSLLAWYRTNRRPLPWRSNRDPYRVWIAEIMLQQTRIAAVLPYYERFLARFPDVQSLARARENEVLKSWAGLGYYSRARNLHKAAREIVEQHEGKFPAELNAALALLGVGPYTAAAILSIAYGASLAAVDGNVARVLARLFAIRGDVREPKTAHQIQQIAELLIPPRASGDWNQALMELGETICTPRTPNCAACPMKRICQARGLHLTHKIPGVRRKHSSQMLSIAAAVFLDAQGRTLLTKIPGAHASVLFSRLWQFPATEIAPEKASESLLRHLRERFGISCGTLIPLAPSSHTVTFRKITLVPFLARVQTLPRIANCRLLPLAAIERVPISSATRKIARAAIEKVANGSPASSLNSHPHQAFVQISSAANARIAAR